MEISFTAYGIAQPKGSTKSFVLKGKNGAKDRAITTSDNPKLKDWHYSVGAQAVAHRPEQLFQGAVGVELKFSLLRPASVSEKKRPLPTVKPDIDKITRAVLDALKGVIYADDCLVIRLVIDKLYGPAPGVEVRVWEVA